MTLTCHVCDIVYGCPFGQFWLDYVKGMEILHSIVPCIYTYGNHEYFDGDASNPNVCGSLIHMYCLLPINYEIMLKNNVLKTYIKNNSYIDTLVNIDISDNQLISQACCQQILGWKNTNMSNELIINCILKSYVGLETSTFNTEFCTNDTFAYGDLFPSNKNKCYIWHLTGQNIPNGKCIILWGHAHSTDVVNIGVPALGLQTGGFGNLQGGGTQGWVEIQQQKDNIFNWVLYNNINYGDYKHNFMKTSNQFLGINQEIKPNFFTDDLFNSYFNLSNGEYNFISTNPNPPNPSKNKCCTP